MAPARDDLERHIAERTASDPELPARIDAALRRRQLHRALADDQRPERPPGRSQGRTAPDGSHESLS